MATNGEFSQFRTRKIWADEKSGHRCMMIYPRDIEIWWGGTTDYWVWDCYKETSDDNIEVARLITVCWLQVAKTIDMSGFPSGVTYEFVFVVKLTKGASGWEHPVYIEVKQPNRSDKRRRYILHDKPKGEWIELVTSSFQVIKGETDVHFNFGGTCGQWKNGLVVKGILVRPKN